MYISRDFIKQNESMINACVSEIMLCVMCNRGNANRMAMWCCCACVRMALSEDMDNRDCGKGLEHE